MKTEKKNSVFILGFIAGALSLALAALLVSVELFLIGESFEFLAGVFLVAHLPLALIEGIITGFIIVFLKRLNLNCWNHHFRSNKMKFSNKVIALVLVLVFSTFSFAHKMHVDAYVASGSKVKGSASYGKSSPVVNAKVRAIAPDGKVLAETKTDKKGEFEFKVEVRCDLKIEVIDGGHKGSTKLPAEDLPSNLPEYKPGK